MSNSFAIHNGASFQLPPSYAAPDVLFPPIIRYQESFISANNVPYAPVRKFAIIGRSAISQVGLDWYRAFTGLNISVPITVRLLDPGDGTWKSYDGFMSSPSIGLNLIGGLSYPDFRVSFSGLEES